MTMEVNPSSQAIDEDGQRMHPLLNRSPSWEKSMPARPVGNHRLDRVACSGVLLTSPIQWPGALMKMLSALVVGLIAATAAMNAGAQANTRYSITKTIPIGAPDRWDYVVFDPVQDRVYVAHGQNVTVVDGASGALLGTIEVGGVTHGIAAVHALGKGYTDDGKAGEAVVFDLQSLKVLGRVKAEPDADGIVYDAKSGHILVIDGDSAKVTVIDPKSDSVAATIEAGGGLEFGVSDEAGKFYVDGEKNNEVVRIDLASNKVDAHWPLTGCLTPHGLAIDRLNKRLFASCANKTMVVMNATDGAVMATFPIGAGTDFAEFDPSRNLAFSSNRDGTLSIVAERSPSQFETLPPVETPYGARTMAVDPKTGRIFLVTADFTVNDAVPVSDRGHYAIKPGSAKLLFLDPAK
jgi:YVTN family beta-propeller protein